MTRECARWLSTGLLLLNAATLSAQSTDTSRLAPGQVSDWKADLAFVRTEMPRQHANLFHSMSRAAFDSALRSIEAKLPTLSRGQVIVELQRLAAAIGDGHTNVSPWRDTVLAFGTLPVSFYRFEDGYVIRAAAREHQELVGARVVAIGGTPIDSAERLVAGLISKDNSMAIWQVAPWLLRMPEVLYALGLAPATLEVRLLLERGGASREVILNPAGRFPNFSGDIDRSWLVPEGWVDARAQAALPHWLRHPDRSYWADYLPDDRLLYLQLNEVMSRSDPLPQFLERAIALADSAGAERLVLDLRLNGGGNGYNVRTILRALIRSRYDAPGRLFVITGRRTFSAAQMLIDELEQYAFPIFVGEPSASRGIQYGDSRRLVLPRSGITLRVSTLYWQYWDPRDTRPWIAPEVAAGLSFADYEAGRDPAMEAIRAYRTTPSLATLLEPAIAAADSAGGLRIIEQFKSVPTNRWREPGRLLADLQRQFVAAGRESAVALAQYWRRMSGIPAILPAARRP